MGTALRLGQLFRKESGRSFIVAFDHGQALPMPHGIGNPRSLVEKIVAGQPDGLLLTAGMFRQCSDLFAHRNAPAAIVRADWTVLDPDMKNKLEEHYRPTIAPSEALALGATAICIYLIGYPAEGRMFADNVHSVARTIHEAHAVGLPVIVEAVLWGSQSPDKKDFDQLRYMCRIAAELGADALKTEYVGDVEKQRILHDEVGDIPVLTLGGASTSSESASSAAQGAIEAGAKGLIFGRNVWHTDNISAVMQALSGIVHR